MTDIDAPTSTTATPAAGTTSQATLATIANYVDRIVAPDPSNGPTSAATSPHLFGKSRSLIAHEALHEFLNITHDSYDHPLQNLPQEEKIAVGTAARNVINATLIAYNADMKVAHDAQTAKISAHNSPQASSKASSGSSTPGGSKGSSAKKSSKKSTSGVTSLKPYEELPPPIIATLMDHLYHIITIAPSGPQGSMVAAGMDILAIYDDDPTSQRYGTYTDDERVIRNIARQFNPGLTTKDLQEITIQLRDTVTRTTRGHDPNLVAVGNGIFHYDTKTLTPFSPDHIVTSKSPIHLKKNPTNPVITHPEDGTTWDVESWMKELHDDPEIVEVLWQIIGAIIRPYVSWNKSAWFYSNVGNNGKGTLLALMRNLCGAAYASIPLADLGKDFMLEPLTSSSAILVDENDVGAFIDKAANLKAIITNDIISINRKYKTPVAYQFHGFMVQCLNSLPQFSDKSDSMYRRQIFIKFEKSFTGKERTYIKDDYLARNDVLEYVLWRVLTMPDYYKISEPAVLVNNLEEFKQFNDPLRAFWGEFRDQFTWSLLPYGYLYDLYKAWLKEVMPSSTPMGRNKFIDGIQQVVYGDVLWTPTTKTRSGNHIATPDPLVADYELSRWMNTSVNPTSPQRNLPAPTALKATYSGLLRDISAPVAPPSQPVTTTPSPTCDTTTLRHPATIFTHSTITINL